MPIKQMAQMPRMAQDYCKPLALIPPSAKQLELISFRFQDKVVLIAQLLLTVLALPQILMSITIQMARQMELLAITITPILEALGQG